MAIGLESNGLGWWTGSVHLWIRLRGLGLRWTDLGDRTGLTGGWRAAGTASMIPVDLLILLQIPLEGFYLTKQGTTYWKMKIFGWIDHRETPIQSGVCCWTRTSDSQDGIKDSRWSVDLIENSLGGIVFNYMGNNILKNQGIWMGRSPGNVNPILGHAAGRGSRAVETASRTPDDLLILLQINLVGL